MSQPRAQVHMAKKKLTSPIGSAMLANSSTAPTTISWKSQKKRTVPREFMLLFSPHSRGELGFSKGFNFQVPLPAPRDHSKTSLPESQPLQSPPSVKTFLSFLPMRPTSSTAEIKWSHSQLERALFHPVLQRRTHDPMPLRSLKKREMPRMCRFWWQRCSKYNS